MSLYIYIYIYIYPIYIYIYIYILSAYKHKILSLVIVTLYAASFALMCLSSAWVT